RAAPAWWGSLDEREGAVRPHRLADHAHAVVGEHVVAARVVAQRAVRPREVGPQRRHRTRRRSVEWSDVLDGAVPELSQLEPDAGADHLPEVGHAVAAG